MFNVQRKASFLTEYKIEKCAIRIIKWNSFFTAYISTITTKSSVQDITEHLLQINTNECIDEMQFDESYEVPIQEHLCLKYGNYWSEFIDGKHKAQNIEME